MKYKYFLIGFLVLLNSFAACYAETVDQYPFSSRDQEQQFHSLITQLRCLVCQNQDLADSNAGLAKDLRMQVYNMVKEGKTDDQVKQYMVARYGDFVLFKPAFEAKTYVLWLMPFLLLCFGAVILWGVVRNRNIQKC